MRFAKTVTALALEMCIRDRDNAVFNYTNQGITDVITHITELNYCYSGGCFIAGSRCV